MRTTKTEIIDHAKLMLTTHLTHTPIEAATARGCASGAPTTPGCTGVGWEYSTGNRQCVTTDQGLNLEQLDSNGIDSPRFDVVGASRSAAAAFSSGRVC